MSPQNYLRVHARQMVAYGLSGGVSFVSGYAARIIANKVLGLGLFPATLAANLTSLIVGFFAQRYGAFGADAGSEGDTRYGWRYAIIFASNILIDYAVVRASKDLLGIDIYFSQFISAGVQTPWNWFWYKYWVFGSRAQKVR